MYGVILIDDEEIIINGLKKVIPWGKYGCDVIGTAEDAKEGSELIRKLSPDILFTDISMPGMDGLAMIAGLRSEFESLEITVLTGYRDFDYAKRAINLGVTRFLLKPSKMSELEEALVVMTANLDKKVIVTAPTVVTEVEADGEKDANSFLVNSALKYIREHCSSKLTLTEVAEKVYVSQWHLSKMLNKYTGESFSDILNNARIVRARELLKDPALKVYEIAELLGFTDVAHFSRIFKKQENVSPGEFRKNILV